MDLDDLNMTSYSTVAEFTFISIVYGTFYILTDHVLGDRASLRKFKKPEITTYIFKKEINLFI